MPVQEKHRPNSPESLDSMPFLLTQALLFVSNIRRIDQRLVMTTFYTDEQIYLIWFTSHQGKPFDQAPVLWLVRNLNIIHRVGPIANPMKIFQLIKGLTLKYKDDQLVSSFFITELGHMGGWTIPFLSDDYHASSWPHTRSALYPSGN